jgi:hypothetical protein
MAESTPLTETDLDLMAQRALMHAEEIPPHTAESGAQYIAYYTADVPRLIAEVRRLRGWLQWVSARAHERYADDIAVSSYGALVDQGLAGASVPPEPPPQAD